MTRGRKKDMSITPSRALTQQRDYRARKAQYVSSLEERCRRAEEDNLRLRKELDEVRAQAAAPATFGPEVVEASSDLMLHLSAASASLARFQRLVIPQSLPPNQETSSRRSQPKPSFIPPSHSQSNTLRPASFPSPSASPPQFYSSTHGLPAASHTRPAPDQSYSHRLHNTVEPRYQSSAPSPSHSESECCGGLMDCTELIEEDEEPEEIASLSRSQVSGLRFAPNGSKGDTPQHSYRS